MRGSLVYKVAYKAHIYVISLRYTSKGGTLSAFERRLEPIGCLTYGNKWEIDHFGCMIDEHERKHRHQ